MKLVISCVYAVAGHAGVEGSQGATGVAGLFLIGLSQRTLSNSTF